MACTRFRWYRYCQRVPRSKVAPRLVLRENASPLKTAQLGICTWNAVSRENRGTDSGHGGSRYGSLLMSQAPSLSSTLVELLTSNPAPEIVIASCSISSRALLFRY